MAKDILMALVMGMLCTVALIVAAGFLVHTDFGAILIPFTVPLGILASVVGYGITKGHAGARWETVQLYGLMILFGGLFYGFVIFCILRSRTKK
jgi:hypothetical protein